VLVDRLDLTTVDEYALLYGARGRRTEIALVLDAARGTRLRWWVMVVGIPRA